LIVYNSWNLPAARNHSSLSANSDRRGVSNYRDQSTCNVRCC